MERVLFITNLLICNYGKQDILWLPQGSLSERIEKEHTETPREAFFYADRAAGGTAEKV